MKEERALGKLSTIIFILLLIPVLFGIFFLRQKMNEEVVATSPTVIENAQETIPVISESKYIIMPYTDTNVKVGKTYYNYLDEESKQEASIVQQDNGYYQNMGIDYTKEDVFDVIAIAKGTVTMVKEDELYGKIVEIDHNNGLISVYQSLSEISVKKGDIIAQGQIIGKSGTSKWDSDLGNHLHFEMIENGMSVNPENYLNKDYAKRN